MEIHLRHLTRPIILTAGNVWFAIFRDTKGMTQSLRELYAYLSEKTYPNRMRPYVNEIDSKGFFSYKDMRAGFVTYHSCETRFYVNGEIVQGNKRINIRDVIMYRNPENGYELRIAERGGGHLKSLFRTLVPFMKVYVGTDQDVFYALLHAMYGVVVR